MANEPHDRVMVGQIWQENPKAVLNRLLKIEKCEGGFAICQEGYTHGNGFLSHKNAKTARIRMDRLKPSKFFLFQSV